MSVHPIHADRDPEPGQALAARLDDIRGLLNLPDLEGEQDLTRVDSLVELAHRLADALEKSQRQLIESNIQLMSLREVANNLLSIPSPDRAAEMVSLYLHKAFAYERVAVLLSEGEGQRLAGWIAARDGTRQINEPVQLSVGDVCGVLGESLRSAEKRLVPAPGRQPLTGNEELNAGFDCRRLNSYVVVPLKGGKTPVPVLGVILAGRANPGPPLSAADLSLLDSIATAVATVVENARLYAEIRQAELFRKDILNCMGAGLVAVDLEGRAILVNETAIRLTGYPRRGVLGTAPPFFTPADKGLQAALRGSLEGTAVARREAVLTRRDETTFPASLSTAPLRDADGRLYGAIATFVDLTEFKRMEERIRQLDRLAVLGRFTAGIAHEIRNPLTGIGTGVQYLTRGLAQDDPQRENAGFILAEIERLNHIVEDLFRVTHPHPLMPTPEKLDRLLERALQSLGNLPAERGLTVSREYDPAGPEAPVDAEQMQQVAINLIKNAVEATPEGGRLVLVTGRRPGRRGEGEWAFFRVIDTGSGMSAEVQKSIFEPFFTRKKSGTGLGLYITHGIVERHGGHLRVESREGAGSTFTVEIPGRPLSNGGAS